MPKIKPYIYFMPVSPFVPAVVQKTMDQLYSIYRVPLLY